MSSKLKTSETKEEAKLALVPKLRFPEFRGADVWESARLGDLCEVITKGSTPTSYGFDYVDSGVRFVKIESLSGGSVDCSKTAYITEGCNNAFLRSQLKGNDILFSIAGALGVIALVDQGILPANVNQAIGIVRLKQGYSHQFLLHQLQGNLIQTEIQRIRAGAAQPNISLSQLGDFAALLPSKAEQQKIAECLSSVDELITAQARKVGALKTHKRGLMQQLFPREGETQPRLRFPEFQNAGEWIREPLGKLCSRIMDGTHFSPKSKDGPRPYLTSKNIKDGRIDLSNLSYISEEEHAEIYSKCPVKLHDVLLTKDGANTGNCALNNLDFEFSLLSSVAVLRVEANKLSQEFLFQSILSDSVQSLITESMSGQAITRITLAKIGRFTISVPRLPEQQRIATCLGSLDVLITAESQKLEALKTHKKALMQQLFPSTEKVEA
jgi:type I restriction enzyme, S subunit